VVPLPWVVEVSLSGLARASAINIPPGHNISLALACRRRPVIE
jgi:hypothetical protein